MVTVGFNAKDLCESLPENQKGQELTETEIFEENVLKYIADTLFENGVDAELRYQDTDYSLLVMGEQVYIGLIPETPEQGLVDALKNLVDELNSSDKLSAYMSYTEGRYSVTIEQKPISQEG